MVFNSTHLLRNVITKLYFTKKQLYLIPFSSKKTFQNKIRNPDKKRRDKIKKLIKNIGRDSKKLNQ